MSQIQNKSVYTRRFNKLKKMLQSHFESPDVSFDDTAVLRWSMEDCIVAHDGSLGFTIHFYDVNTGNIEHSLGIVKTRGVYRGGLVGVHVRDTDLNHILDCIDTAIKDGFENIYVESIK